MLFHSFVFLFVFLPVVLAGYYLCGWLFLPRVAQLWLGASSLAFYAYWNLASLWVLLVTIGFNLAVSHVLARSIVPRRRVLIAAPAIAANLIFLAWFKFAAKGAAMEGIAAVALPLGISFFTFEAVSYLVDSLRGRERPARPAEYLLYVAFFPHLISGPIVRFRQLMAQFAAPDVARPQVMNLAAGLTLLTLGLAKKCLIADHAALIANEAFRLLASGQHFTAVDAWLGALGYTVQIYFDFSGYSDMACGLALLFNVRLPANFLSPYQAVNIGDFWRRWHITLSTFLRDYLYIPLGGNRCGVIRRNFNLLLTMLLGGLWHGAGWSFLAWGLLHAFYLIIFHTWRGVVEKLPRLALPRPLAWGITFLAVVLAWVFFRAPGLPAALTYVGIMFTPGTWPLPAAAEPCLGFLGKAVRFGVPMCRGTYPLELIALVLGALLVALVAPNSLQIVRAARPADADIPPARFGQLPLRWIPTPLVAGTVGLLFLATLWWRPTNIEFLYFQF